MINLSKRSSTESESRHSRTNYGPAQTHPKTLIEMCIICLDLVWLILKKVGALMSGL